MKGETKPLSLLDKLKASSAEQVINYMLNLLPQASDTILMKGLNILEMISTTEEKRQTIKAVRAAFESDHPAKQLAKRLLKELHPNCKRGLVSGFIVRSILADARKRAEYFAVYGEKPPFTVLISPTMRCNLRCEGCYASNYTRATDLSLPFVNKIIEDCRQIGVCLITILGGEPFVYPEIMDVFRENKDMVFQVFTNGTLVNQRLAQEIVELGNVALALSVDGLEKETDDRRGKGTFNKVMQAMDYLREQGALFLFSVCSTRKNYEAVTSDEFVDLMVEKGAALGWYFNYMPVGSQPDLELMPTPEQRNYVRKRVSELRRTKPILLVDFFGDGPLVNGCLAGGKLYLHINNAGDVEPCIFCHFAVDNVKEKSLAEAINSDFFRGIRRMQPFCHNDLHPCMLIDHPKIIKKLVTKYGAKPTHKGAETLITELHAPLSKYSERIASIYEEVWKQEYQWVNDWQRRNVCM